MLLFMREIGRVEHENAPAKSFGEKKAAAELRHLRLSRQAALRRLARFEAP
jgi:hypothetical protein